MPDMEISELQMHMLFTLMGYTITVQDERSDANEVSSNSGEPE